MDVYLVIDNWGKVAICFGQLYSGMFDYSVTKEFFWKVFGFIVGD